MSLLFPIDKSFYKSDDLFKHDFLLRRSFDTIDLLWYRTHEPLEITDPPASGLDEKELWRIERTVEDCPDNELQSARLQSLAELIQLQTETEIFDFYFEHYFQKTVGVIKDDAMIQQCAELIHDLKVIESEELTIDYEGYWDYIYEKACLKTMISPEVLDKNAKSYNKMRRFETSKNKVNSDSTDLTVKETEVVQRREEMSLMNARVLMQQLKEKGLEEDRLTYINLFADDDEGDYMDKDVSSSGTVSVEVDDYAADVFSRMTEVSYEKQNDFQGDVDEAHDPFKDRSYDSLYYAARQVFDRLKSYSDQYFTEAPVVLLENDLVLEMKDREFKYLSFYNKAIETYLVKITDKDGNEGFSSRQFRHGVLRTTDLVLSQMERTKQEAVATVKIAGECDRMTLTILRSPKVVESDYRKLMEFDMKDEEVKRVGQKKKLKNYKTMVCLAGRTKLRRYDYCEGMTLSYNNMREPMRKIAQSTQIAQEHANIGISSYLDALLSIIRKRMVYDNFPTDLYTRLNEAIDKTKQVLNDLDKLKAVYNDARETLSKNIFKPQGEIRKNSGNTIKQRQHNKEMAVQEMEYLRSALWKIHTPGHTSNINVVLKKTDKGIKEKRPLNLDLSLDQCCNKKLIRNDYFISPNKSDVYNANKNHTRKSSS